MVAQSDLRRKPRHPSVTSSSRTSSCHPHARHSVRSLTPTVTRVPPCAARLGPHRHHWRSHGLVAVEVVEAVLAWPCDVSVLAASPLIVAVLHMSSDRCTRHTNEASAAESMACELARHHNAELAAEDGDVVR